MNNLIKYIALTLAILLPALANAEEGQETESQVAKETTQESAEVADRTAKFRPVVMPFYDPTIEIGASFIPMYAFYPSEKDLVSDASTIYLPMIYTSNKSYIAKLGGDIILFEDSVRITFLTGYANANTPLGAGLEGTVQSMDFDADVMFKVANNIYLGVGGIYDSNRYLTDSEESDLELANRGYNLDWEGDAGYRISLLWDTREHYYYAHEGFQFKINYEDHAEWLGNESDRTYSSVLADFRIFHSLTDDNRHIIAAKTTGRYLIDADTAPSSSYSRYGRQGRELQRGFQQGEYTAANMFNAEAEYRYRFGGTNIDFINKSGITLIGGVGKSFGTQLPDGTSDTREVKKFQDSEWLGMVGFGYRYRLLEYERMNLKVDVTHNTDGETFIYFGMGETIQ